MGENPNMEGKMKIYVANIENRVLKANIISGLVEINKEYFLEDALHGTLAQGRILHLLIQEYFNSGLYSDNVKTWLELREHIKRRLGEGFEKIIYVDDDYKIREVKYKDRHLIPNHIRKDPDRIRGKLKSFADYTKNQRKNIISNVIIEMETVGVNSKRFNEILNEFN